MTPELYYDLTARIVAVEFLVKQALWMKAEDHVDQHGGTTEDAVSALSDAARSTLRTSTVPGDPAISDHLADLSAGHVQRVLRELLAEMTRP